MSLAKVGRRDDEDAGNRPDLLKSQKRLTFWTDIHNQKDYNNDHDARLHVCFFRLRFSREDDVCNIEERMKVRRFDPDSGGLGYECYGFSQTCLFTSSSPARNILRRVESEGSSRRREETEFMAQTRHLYSLYSVTFGIRVSIFIK